MINVERQTPAEQPIANMREVTMLHDENVRPYEEAEITLEEIEIDDFKPTTLYVLKPGLIRQDELRRELLSQGYDPLRLDGSLHIRADGSHESVGLTPPIIEEDPEHGPVLLDGAHRVYRARQLGFKAINGLYISNVTPDYPISSFPNEWDEVIEYDKTPRPELKKKYRPGYEPGELYRDLAPINGSKRRGV